MTIAFTAGMLLGFLGSVPSAGPLSILVAAKGLSGNRKGGMAMAFGGALAEAIYAFLASWGASRVLGANAGLMHYADLLAALLLVGLGIFFMKRRDFARVEQCPRCRPAASFFTGLLVCGLNPGLILHWSIACSALVAFGFLGANAESAFAFAPGVFAGVCLWFFLLLTLLSRLRLKAGLLFCQRLVSVMAVCLIVLGGFFGVRFIAGF